ncbi:MAG: sigma factor [Planctomycetota bacterium]
MDSFEDRLSRIETSWSVLRNAHDPETDAARAAQQDLLDRYGGAVRRYALAALRNEEAADEVFQEFALRFVRGDLAGADQSKGRFRSFVKTCVYHLIVDYQRRGKRNAKVSPFRTETPEPKAPTEEVDHDELFSKTWRDDLLTRVWDRLDKHEQSTGKPYHTALQLRVANPEVRSPELAELLSQKLGKPMKAGAARVLIHRARETFGELLLEEVAHSLPDASRDQLQEELIDLNLFEYCRPVFEKQSADLQAEQE